MISAVVIAITGGSGALYGQRLVERALGHFERVYLTISQHAVRVIEEELGIRVDLERFRPEAFLPPGAEASRVRFYPPRDFDAPFASGSAAPEAMAIVPCSMGTLGRIAAGVSDDLITRAADVMLKERRRLVLLARETPLTLTHLRNMVAVTEMGAIVAPPVPAFYARPASLAEMVDHTLGRVLDLFDLDTGTAHRWQGVAAARRATDGA